MLLVNQNNVVDAKSVNASLIALKNQADKLNRQIATLEKSIKSLDGSKADEKELSNYYTKGEVYNKNETYNKTEVYNTSEITNNYYNKQSVDGKFNDYATSKRFILLESIDLNTLKNSGRYFAKDDTVGNGCSNKPQNITYAFYLEVISENPNKTIHQIFHTVHGVTFFRSSGNGGNTWISWQKLVTESELPKVVEIEKILTSSEVSNKYFVINNELNAKGININNIKGFIASSNTSGFSISGVQFQIYDKQGQAMAPNAMVLFSSSTSTGDKIHLFVECFMK